MAVPSFAELRLAIGVRKGTVENQRDLALRAGVSQSYLSQIEAGTRRPSAKILLRLARALDVPLEDVAASIRETIRRQRVGEPQLPLLP